MACIDGHNRAQGGDDLPPPLTADDFDEMMLRHTERRMKLNGTVRK